MLGARGPAVLVFALAAAGCTLITGASSLDVGDNPSSPDAGPVLSSEAGAGDAAAAELGIALDPDRITTAENVSVDVAVALTRSPKTTGAVDVTVQGLPASVAVSALSIPPGANDGKLTFQIGTAPAQRSTNLFVRATADSEIVTVPLVLVVTPNLFVKATGGVGTYVVPASVTKIDVRAWGGGGGGGGGFQGVKGGSGGGGGFAQATVTVTAGETLDILVGEGGGFGPTLLSAGGGGGGMTTLSRTGSPLVLAAGGGGGGGAGGSMIVPGAGGGAGGGAIGQDGVSSNPALGIRNGFGGTQTQGGKGPCGICSGSASRGGQGETNSGAKGIGGAGGNPGGGGGGGDNTTSFGGGGGGAGFFGGGGAAAGGNTNPVAGSGGGGGSSFVNPSATSPNLVAGDLATAGDANDVYYANAAGAGGIGGAIFAGTNGKPGRLVIVPQ